MIATTTFYVYDWRGIARGTLFAVSLFIVLLAVFAAVATATPIVLAMLAAIAPTVAQFLGCVALLVGYVYATKPRR